MQNESPSTSPVRILRRKEVEQRIGLSRSFIYMKMEDGTFPKPIRLSGAKEKGKGAVAWLEHEIDAWLQERITARDNETIAK